MAFFKQGNIYGAIYTPSYSRCNILGISFAEKNSSETTIEVMECNYPKSDFTKSLEKRMAKWDKSEKSKIGTSPEEVLKQVLSGLNPLNEVLGTNYQLSKIYYLPFYNAPFEDESDLIYHTLIRTLIRYYHSGNEFQESLEDNF